MTFKEAQAVYHKLTGKTEEITRPISKYYIIDWPDLDQLNIKLKQVLDQF